MFNLNVKNCRIDTAKPLIDLEIDREKEHPLYPYRVWDGMNCIGHIQPLGKSYIANPFYGLEGKKPFKNSEDAISYVVNCYLIWSEAAQQ